MAILNVTVNSTSGSLIDGQYWFVARFYNSSGVLISDPNFPQNQIVSASSPLPSVVSIQVGDGTYTINNVIVKLFPLNNNEGEKNISGVSVQCSPQGCVSPSYSTAILEDPVCINNTTDGIGVYKLTGLSNYNRYRLYTGTPSTGGYNGATNSTSSTLNLNIQFPLNTGSTNYTLRLYNGSDTCTTDIPFVANAVDCSDEHCCDMEIVEWTIDVDPTIPINCDLKHDSAVEYRVVNDIKQIRVHVYSARPNIGPFVIRIYNQQNNIVQTINNVDVHNWININNLPADTYSVTVTDKDGCSTTKSNFVIVATNCDLVQTVAPTYETFLGNKRIKATVYSPTPNLGPFTFRIYDGSNLIQTINNVIDPNDWVNIDNAMSIGTYKLTITDNRGCTTGEQNFTII